MDKMTLDELARYCDGVVYHMVRYNGNEFLKRNLEENIVSFDNWNITSAGNLAHIILFSNDEDLKLTAQTLLKTYLNWLSNNTSDQKKKINHIPCKGHGILE